MTKYQLRVEIDLTRFLDDLTAAIEKALSTQIPASMILNNREKIRNALKEVLNQEIAFNDTCGLSLACKEAVLYPPWSPEAEKIRAEEKKKI